MLKITIPAMEQFNEQTNEFIRIKQQDLQLEHSLVSISKWESKWCKPFLSKTPMSNEETLDYIRCMTLTQNVDPNVYNYIPVSVLKEIMAYIEAPMTATWFNDRGPQKRTSEVVTSELIYYWMIALQIPPEYQKWHLNRLLTLIRICNIKNGDPKKMDKKGIYSQNAALNRQRRAAMHSKG